MLGVRKLHFTQKKLPIEQKSEQEGGESPSDTQGKEHTQREI